MEGTYARRRRRQPLLGYKAVLKRNENSMFHHCWCVDHVVLLGLNSGRAERREGGSKWLTLGTRSLACSLLPNIYTNTYGPNYIKRPRALFRRSWQFSNPMITVHPGARRLKSRARDVMAVRWHLNWRSLFSFFQQQTTYEQSQVST